MKKSRFYYSAPEFEARVAITMDGMVYPLTSKMTPRPRLTLCGVLDTETNVLSFGASVCSSKDRFEKKIGRALAEKRAIETPLVKVCVTKDDISEVFISTATQLERRIMSMKNRQLIGNL